MAILCSGCDYNYNPDDAKYCCICGEILTRRSEGMHSRNVDYHRASGTPGIYLHPLSEENDSTFGVSATMTECMGHTPAGQGEISGRIVFIERHDERPPSDFFKTCSKALIFILIFVPFVFLFLFIGFLSVIFAFLGFQAMAQLLNPQAANTPPSN
jgi:hypothetical protein